MPITLAIVLLLAVLVVIALAAKKPGQLSVQRETVIDAPPAKVCARINDFHAWPRWSARISRPGWQT